MKAGRSFFFFLMSYKKVNPMSPRHFVNKEISRPWEARLEDNFPFTGAAAVVFYAQLGCLVSLCSQFFKAETRHHLETYLLHIARNVIH